MRKAEIFVNNRKAGILTEVEFGRRYLFEYLSDYSGPPVSLTMPVSQSVYEFNGFPAFFDGLLPEGHQLEGLLKYAKLDRNDHFAQLVVVGNDLVGHVTVKEIPA
jgi:serine/threonine-protein kinase HipA